VRHARDVLGLPLGHPETFAKHIEMLFHAQKRYGWEPLVRPALREAEALWKIRSDLAHGRIVWDIDQINASAARIAHVAKVLAKSAA
jgi:hypothetical protein